MYIHTFFVSMCIYIYIYNTSHIYIYIYIYMCICVCIYIYIYIYIHTHIIRDLGRWAGRRLRWGERTPPSCLCHDIYISLSLYIYIYIYRVRDRERERERLDIIGTACRRLICDVMYMCAYICIMYNVHNVCIYIYIYNRESTDRTTVCMRTDRTTEPEQPLTQIV